MPHVRTPLVLAAVLWTILAAEAAGDGAFVWKRGADLNEPSQKAIVYWKQGKEVLVLQVKYEGPAEDFAWVVPLPSKPKVDAIEADKSPFAEISLYTQRRLRWGYRGDMDKGGGPSPETVTVLERKVVGVYDVAVLAASDAGALSDWLNKNGYAFPDNRTDVLEHYTTRKWVYVAMRVDRKALASDEVKRLRVGELQPIRFAFDADDMVYPLKISSINAGYTEVLLYCLAEVPMVAREAWFWKFSMEANLPNLGVCRNPQFGDLDSGTYRKARGDELPLTWAALGAAKDEELSVCKYRHTYRADEMADDLTFQPFEAQAYWRQHLARAESDRLQALNVLASHDPQLLEELATSPERNSRLIAAGHPKTPNRLLAQLAEDEDAWLRRQVAQNPNASAHILAKLARDEDSGIRYAVSLRPETPVESLRTLAADPSANVRYGVARHPKATMELLRELAEDEDHNVRLMVARQDKAPVGVLRKLAVDKDDQVARWARQTLQRRAGAESSPHDEEPKNGSNPSEAKLPSRLLYYQFSGASYGAGFYLTGLSAFELDLENQRLRKLRRHARDPQPMLPHAEKEIVALLGREKWEALSEESYTSIKSAVLAWLRTRPPKVYSRPRGLGYEDGYAESMITFFGDEKHVTEFEPRAAGRPNEPSRPPSQCDALIEAVMPQPVGPQPAIPQ